MEGKGKLMDGNTPLTDTVRARMDEYRETIEKLRDTVQSLRDDNQLHEEFVAQCTELIPEGYDGDEAPEVIILRYLKDMSDLGGIIARLTSAYR